MAKDSHPRAPKRWPGRQPSTRAASLLPRGAGLSLLARHETPPALREALERAKAAAEAKRLEDALGML